MGRWTPWSSGNLIGLWSIKEFPKELKTGSRKLGWKRYSVEWNQEGGEGGGEPGQAAVYLIFWQAWYVVEQRVPAKENGESNIYEFIVVFLILYML